MALSIIYRFLRNGPSLIAVFTAFVSLIVTSGLLVSSIEITRTSGKIEDEIRMQEIETIMKTSIENVRDEMQDAINEFMQAVELSDDAIFAARLDQMDQKISEIDTKLKIIQTIEQAIMQNPERAMSIPILRRDIDTIKQDIIAESSVLRAEIARVYDLGKWFIGLIATMAIGVLGLAIGNLIKGKD